MKNSLFKKLGLASAVLAMSVALVACSNNTNTSSKSNNEASTTAASGEVAKGTIDEIDGKTLDSALEDEKAKENYLVIDVRPKEQYEEGHVQWAINIPVDEIENNIDRIKRYVGEKEIVTICNTGKKSAAAAEKLADAGINVLNAQGVKDYNYTTMTKVEYVLGDTLQALVNNNKGEYYIIDARSKEKDYEAGHLKGAHYITVDEIDSKISEIPKDKKPVVYCYSGNKSNAIAQKLAAAGYKGVINATDGTKEYDGFELVTE